MVQFIKVNSRKVNNMARALTLITQMVIFTKEVGLTIIMMVRV